MLINDKIKKGSFPAPTPKQIPFKPFIPTDDLQETSADNQGPSKHKGSLLFPENKGEWQTNTDPQTSINHSPETFHIFMNNKLGHAQFGGYLPRTVVEPSVAMAKEWGMLSANSYSTGIGAQSLNGGKTWEPLNIKQIFPETWCDQHVLYVPSIECMIWVNLNTGKVSGQSVEIAVFNEPYQEGSSVYRYDIRAQDIYTQSGDEYAFDYPQLACSSDHLYITLCVNKNWVDQDSIAIRLPLEKLKTHEPLGHLDYIKLQPGIYVSPSYGLDRQYFVQIGGIDQSGDVYCWYESGALEHFPLYFGNVGFGNFSAQCPSGSPTEWLARLGTNPVQAAWMEGDILCFAFCSEVNLKLNRPYPYVVIIRVDTVAKKVIGQYDIWNSEYAYVWPSITVNDNGTLGISVQYGGGEYYPSPAVGVGFFSGERYEWELTSISEGRTVGGQYGDFLCCQPKFTDKVQFVASNFAWQDTGSKNENGHDPEVRVNFVSFEMI
ncbi:hypothetical protein KFE98_17100 [bacterium SCSIO 12741]|nr:hypothetical protein KFE98_17100 [bacterium SCSIO 12741]